MRRVLYLIGWVCFLAALILAWRSPEAASWRLCSMGWVFAMTMWCREDAIIAGKPLPTMSLWLVLVLWPVALPVCLIRVHGVFYGLLLTVLHAVLYGVLYAYAAHLLGPR